LSALALAAESDPLLTFTAARRARLCALASTAREASDALLTLAEAREAMVVETVAAFALRSDMRERERDVAAARSRAVGALLELEVSVAISPPRELPVLAQPVNDIARVALCVRASAETHAHDRSWSHALGTWARSLEELERADAAHGDRA